MINKNNLCGISGLNVSGIVNTFSDSEYGRYCELLDEFVDKFPAQEAMLKDFFKAGNHEGFVDTLMELKATLVKIYAEGLALRCDSLLKSTRDANRDMAEASLSHFLNTASMLSIEIQMAKYKDDATAATARPVVIQPKLVNLQKTILAVDDVSFLLNMLRVALQGTEYKFTGVNSGAAALRFLKDHTVDLFLLDIEMPEMNGYELAQKIKQGGHTAPIIFLTGNAKRENVVKAMQVGAVDFIVKPVNKEQMLERIRHYIG